jgi:hypothetical protein
MAEKSGTELRRLGIKLLEINHQLSAIIDSPYCLMSGPKISFLILNQRMSTSWHQSMMRNKTQELQVLYIYQGHESEADLSKHLKYHYDTK